MTSISTAAGPILYDDFNDNALNPSLWTSGVEGSGVTVTETNQRLEIAFSATAAGAAFSAGYSSVCQLRGDFDIQVDFELLTWPSQNGVRVGLSAGGAGVVERVSFGRGDFNEKEVYVTHFADFVQGFIPTSDRSGTLRLVRTGSTLTGFFGGGVLIHSGPSGVGTADVSFGLSAWSHDERFADQAVKVAFDNMIVTQGELIGSCTPPFIVNSTADNADRNLEDGVCYTGFDTLDGEPECTLRAAIEQANHNAGQDTITFNIPTTDPGFNLTDNTFTIEPVYALPDIIDPLTIDATTQPGSKVVLDGTSAGADVSGLHIAANDVAVKALEIRGFSAHGVFSLNPGQVVLEGVKVVDNAGLGVNVSGALAISGTANEVSRNGQGGVVSVDIASIGNITITGNCGVGIGVSNGSLTIDNATVKGNGIVDALGNPCQRGGGILVNTALALGKSVSGRSLVVSGNGGDGIYVYGDATLENIEVLINEGAGVRAQGDVAIVNGKVCGNADGDILGGGVFNLQNVIYGAGCGFQVFCPAPSGPAPAVTVTAGVPTAVTIAGTGFEDAAGVVDSVKVQRGGSPADVSFTVLSNVRINATITGSRHGKLPRSQDLIVHKSDRSRAICNDSVTISP